MATSLELVRNQQELSTLAQAVQNAGMDDVLRGDVSLTLFAPTDDAFAALGEATLEQLTRNPTQLAEILRLHIVPGEKGASELEQTASVTSLTNTTLTVDARNGDLRVGGAKVTQPDLRTDNGVVHLIDTLIVPERFYMQDRLKGKTVAILCTDGVEMLELTNPRQALEAAGAKTVLIAPHGGAIKAWEQTNWGPEFKVDMATTEAKDAAEKGEFDALHLPGGPLNADVLRSDDFSVYFIREYFFKQNKPVSVLCHAPWLLAEADVARGRVMTSYPCIATDLRNAGAIWINKAAVRDGNLVTGRHPADTPEFNREMIDLFATWQHSLSFDDVDHVPERYLATAS